MSFTSIKDVWSKIKAKVQSHPKRTVGLVIGAALVFAPPAKAIFGLGDIVFDPSAFATLGHIWSENISTGEKIIQETNQLIKIYSTGMALVENAQYMKQRFSSGTRTAMMTAIQSGADNYTRNHYGETVLWPQAMNGAPAMAPQAWENASVTMQANSYASPALGSPESAALALVEMIDGASVQCMENLGQYRQNAIANAQPISFFRLKMSDDSDSTGSQIEQMILGNFAQAQNNNELRAQGTIQTCEATQQMLANKQVRDEIVSSMNYNAHLQQVLNQPGWDASNAFAGRMP